MYLTKESGRTGRGWCTAKTDFYRVEGLARSRRARWEHGLYSAPEQTFARSYSNRVES
jgi:hypothetical protein